MFARKKEDIFFSHSLSGRRGLERIPEGRRHWTEGEPVGRSSDRATNFSCARAGGPGICIVSPRRPREQRSVRGGRKASEPSHLCTATLGRLLWAHGVRPAWRSGVGPRHPREARADAGAGRAGRLHRLPRADALGPSLRRRPHENTVSLTCRRVRGDRANGGRSGSRAEPPCGRAHGAGGAAGAEPARLLPPTRGTSRSLLATAPLWSTTTTTHQPALST